MLVGDWIIFRIWRFVGIVFGGEMVVGMEGGCWVENTDAIIDVEKPNEGIKMHGLYKPF